MADPPSCQMVPIDSVLSSATGFLGQKADRNPRICFGRKTKKGRGKAGREGVGEGMRREAGLGRKACCSMLPSGGGLRSCGDLREVLPGEAWDGRCGGWQLVGDFCF